MPPEKRTHHHQSFAKGIKSKLTKPQDPAASLQEILKIKYVISKNQIVGSSTD